MTTGGWITLIVSVGSVVTLFGWCLFRVLWHKPKPDPSHLHGMDIEPKDTEER